MNQIENDNGPQKPNSAHTILWQVFSDSCSREVVAAPANMVVLTMAPVISFSQRVGNPGSDPRETCKAAIEQCYRLAAEHKQYAEGAEELGDQELELNHVLARAAKVGLARSIELLVYSYDNGIHGRKWPT